MFAGIKISRWHTEAGVWDIPEPETNDSLKLWNRMPCVLEEGNPASPPNLSQLIPHLQSLLQHSPSEATYPIAIIMPWDWKPWYSSIGRSLRKAMGWPRLSLISEPLAMAAFHYRQHGAPTPMVIDISRQALALIDIKDTQGVLREKDSEVFNFPLPSGGRKELLERILAKADAGVGRGSGYPVSVLAHFLDSPFTPQKLGALYRERYLPDPENQQHRLLTQVESYPIELGVLLEAETEWMETLRPALNAAQAHWQEKGRQVVLTGELGTHPFLKQAILDHLGCMREHPAPPEAAILGGSFLSAGQVSFDSGPDYTIAILANKPYYQEEEGAYRFKEANIEFNPKQKQDFGNGKFVFKSQLFRFTEPHVTLRLLAYPFGLPEEAMELQIPVQLPDGYLQHTFRLGIQSEDEQSWQLVLESTLNKHRIFQPFQLP